MTIVISTADVSWWMVLLALYLIVGVVVGFFFVIHGAGMPHYGTRSKLDLILTPLWLIVLFLIIVVAWPYAIINELR